MKKSLTLFLQILIVVIGITALIFLLWEPHGEGRNIHATLFEIYFKDPFLAYAYFASTFFFIALYQAFKVLGLVRNNDTPPKEVVMALQTIQNCALAIIGFVLLGEMFILGKSDDRPAAIMLGLIITCGSLVVARVAKKFEQISMSKIHSQPAHH